MWLYDTTWLVYMINFCKIRPNDSLHKSFRLFYNSYRYSFTFYIYRNCLVILFFTKYHVKYFLTKIFKWILLFVYLVSLSEAKRRTVYCTVIHKFVLTLHFPSFLPSFLPSFHLRHLAFLPCSFLFLIM